MMSSMVLGTEPAAAAPPAAPVMSSPANNSTYHPYENIRISWAAVAGATRYMVEFNNTVESGWPGIDVLNGATSAYLPIADLGPWKVRVRAVNAAGEISLPSAERNLTIAYNAPIAGAPALTSPAAGATVGTPTTLTWNDSSTRSRANYYVVQVHNSATFPSDCCSTQAFDQPTVPTSTFVGLTAGTKYWRVRAIYGNSSSTAPALSAWSATRSFTVVAAPPGVASVELAASTAYSGDYLSFSRVTITSLAPAGGAVVTLSSSNPSALQVPASVTVPAGVVSTDFTPRALPVTGPTTVTVTATYSGVSRSATVVVNPASLRNVEVNPASPVGGFQAPGLSVWLNGRAAAGQVFSATSSHPGVLSVPASTVVQSETAMVNVPATTAVVATDTTVTVTVSWNGASISAPIVVRAPRAPEMLYPFHGTTLAEAVPTVSWNDPNGSVRWEVDFDGVVTSTTSQFLTVNASIGTHTFRVRGFSASNAATPWASSTFTRTGTSTPPSAPGLLSPATGTRFTVGTAVTFDWSDVAGAVSYELQVDDVSTFTAPVIVQLTVTSSTATVSSLTSGRRYWRVRAVNASGQRSVWSAVRRIEMR